MDQDITGMYVHREGHDVMVTTAYTPLGRNKVHKEYRLSWAGVVSPVTVYRSEKWLKSAIKDGTLTRKES